jgi:hypothetical protein
MVMRDIQPVINMLSELIHSSPLDAEKIDEAFDLLEDVKDNIDVVDNEALYKIDELQDNLQDLITLEEACVTQEIKEEIAEIIATMQKW